MKKVGLLFILVFVVLGLTSFVSALTFEEGLHQLAGGIGTILKFIFNPLLGGADSDILFQRVLIAVLLFSIIILALKRVPLFEEQSKLAPIVAGIVAILATRFTFKEELLEAILFQYNILGIVMTVLVPFIIFFFFIESFENSAIRKIGWIFYGVIFVSLGGYFDDNANQLAWVYFLTALVSFLFMLFDGTIQRVRLKSKMEFWGKNTAREFEIEIRRKLVAAKRDLTEGVISPTEFTKIEKRLRKLMKTVHSS